MPRPMPLPMQVASDRMPGMLKVLSKSTGKRGHVSISGDHNQ